MASTSAASYFLYILRCHDGTFYIGRTTNVPDRLERHNAGRGAAWTASRLPVKLVYQEQLPSEASAISRERQLKRWSHNKKLALIHGDHATLKSLAKRRIH